MANKIVRAATGEEMAAVLLAQLEREADLVAELAEANAKISQLERLADTLKHKTYLLQDRLHTASPTSPDRARWLSVQYATKESTHVVLHYLPGILFVDVYQGNHKAKQDAIDLTENDELSDLFDGNAWYMPRAWELIETAVFPVEIRDITAKGLHALQEETAEDNNLPPFIQENYK